MEIKHTIEILTKDIQDIENLVRNLNKYPTPPRIELDLAMSKLRNVYELLSMISADIKSDAADLKAASFPIAEEKERVTEAVLKAEDVEVKAAEPEQAQVIKKPIPVPESPPEPQPVIEEPNKEGSQEESTKAEPVNELPFTEKMAKPEPETKRKEVKGASILAEKFGHNRSINEEIAPGGSSDISGKLAGEPIDQIGRNIGINDRFLIIRELLEGDNNIYNQLIQALDGSSDFNNAYKLLETTFPEQMDHEGVKILLNLSKRKFQH